MMQWAGLSQTAFEAIPKQNMGMYHVDFARHFFASPEAEKAERAALYASLKQLESLKGRVAASADNLLNAMQLNGNIQVLLHRHHSYLYLRHAINTNDDASINDDFKLNSEVNSGTAFLRQEVIQLDDRSLADFAAQKPALKAYLFAIDGIRRHRPFVLSQQEEEILDTTAPFNTMWQAELYDKISANTPIIPPKSQGRDRREEAFKNDYAATGAQRDIYAFILTHLASARDKLATLHHFPDAPTEAYFESYWARAEVDNLLEQLAKQADLYKRYQLLRADHVKKVFGFDTVNLWDINVNPPGMPPPRFTIDEASRIIREALSPLGPDYGRELAALLDPANGRMDIVPGDHRKGGGGGFSLGFIGTDSVFFTQGFYGRYNDVRALAHESTHAVQRQLMTDNNVLPDYAEGPHYLFEGFAIFSEFLLLDYLYTHETDPSLKQYYLEQFFDGKGMEMFRVAPEVAVEHAVYDGVRKGSVKGADDLDSLTKKIYSRYSIWPERHDELKAEWIYIPLMYDDPFYDINYVYGSLLALKMFELYKSDPKHFAPPYIALMKNGFTAPPEELLKHYLNIDLQDPALLSGATKILKDKVDLLEQSYKE